MSSTTNQPDQASSSSSTIVRPPKRASSYGQHRTTNRTRVLRIIGRSMLGLMVLVGLALVTCWLVVTPKKPVFSLERGVVTLHSLTDRKLNASVSFHIRSFNPNKKAAIHIDYMMMTINEMGRKFEMVMRNFSQVPGNLIVLSPTIPIDFVYPLPRLQEKVKFDGISPELHFSANIRYIINGWISKSRLMEIYCNRHMLKINGSTPLDNIKCNVDL
ncbi:hypothetical protein SDJN03_18748, partial [Cucurbita argyrosperma subsp. sororia]